MFGIPFAVITTFLAGVMLYLELNSGHAVQSYLQLQGIGVASTLAGDAQQTLVVTENQSGTDAPVKAGYFLKRDGSAEMVATDTWQKNVGQQNPGPWTNLSPAFNLSRQDLNTPVGELDTVSTTLSATVPMSMVNQTTTELPMQTTVASTVHNTLN